MSTPAPHGAGAGLLAATIATFETAHDLALYAFIAPTAVALHQHGELQIRALRNMEANASEDQLNADQEALNRSTANLEALAHLGSTFVAHRALVLCSRCPGPRIHDLRGHGLEVW